MFKIVLRDFLCNRLLILHIEFKQINTQSTRKQFYHYEFIFYTMFHVMRGSQNKLDYDDEKQN